VKKGLSDAPNIIDGPLLTPLRGRMEDSLEVMRVGQAELNQSSGSG